MPTCVPVRAERSEADHLWRVGRRQKTGAVGRAVSKVELIGSRVQ